MFFSVDFLLKYVGSFNIRHPNGHGVLGICINFSSFFNQFEVSVNSSTLNEIFKKTYSIWQLGFFKILFSPTP